MREAKEPERVSLDFKDAYGDWVDFSRAGPRATKRFMLSPRRQGTRTIALDLDSAKSLLRSLRIAFGQELFPSPNPALLEEAASVWRLVVRGRRYVAVARDGAGAIHEAAKRWPAVDFSRVVPVRHRDDNF